MVDMAAITLPATADRAQVMEAVIAVRRAAVTLPADIRTEEVVDTRAAEVTQVEAATEVVAIDRAGKLWKT
jgi:hypothetical protein